MGKSTSKYPLLKMLIMQESCIVNWGGTTLNSFKFGTGIHKKDPISVYMFNLEIEVVFGVIKSYILHTLVIKCFSILCPKYNKSTSGNPGIGALK